MTPLEPGAVTRLLADIRGGDADARNRLVSLVYDELRQVAAGLVRRRDGSLPPTAIVHEAFLRLDVGPGLARAPDRRYLFAAAAQAMRQVLVDHARERGAAKRGAGRARVPLDDVLDHFAEQHIDVLALNEALDGLRAVNERQWLVVVMRFFGGFSVEEVAETLELSVSSVESAFRAARAWLRRALTEPD